MFSSAACRSATCCSASSAGWLNSASGPGALGGAYRCTASVRRTLDFTRLPLRGYAWRVAYRCNEWFRQRCAGPVNRWLMACEGLEREREVEKRLRSLQT
jgi:hypothetical protein